MWFTFRRWCWINRLVKWPFCGIMTWCFISIGTFALLIRPPTQISPSWSTKGSSLCYELDFLDARLLPLTCKLQRIWGSSWKCSYCKHLLMVFSASWISDTVTLGTIFSTTAFDLVTGFPGFFTSLPWNLDFSYKHRAMTFIAWDHLDTPSSLLVSKWSGNRTTLLTFMINMNPFLTSRSDSWRGDISTISGLQGPFFHRGSGLVRHCESSDSCFAVSPCDASSKGLLLVSM